MAVLGCLAFMSACWLPASSVFSFTAGMGLGKGYVSPVTPLVWMQNPDFLLGIDRNHQVGTTVSSPAPREFL